MVGGETPVRTLGLTLAIALAATSASQADEAGSAAKTDVPATANVTGDKERCLAHKPSLIPDDKWYAVCACMERRIAIHTMKGSQEPLLDATVDCSREASAEDIRE
jgi:hypothetical protein